MCPSDLIAALLPEMVPVHISIGESVAYAFEALLISYIGADADVRAFSAELHNDSVSGHATSDAKKRQDIAGALLHDPLNERRQSLKMVVRRLEIADYFVYPTQ